MYNPEDNMPDRSKGPQALQLKRSLENYCGSLVLALACKWLACQLQYFVQQVILAMFGCNRAFTFAHGPYVLYVLVFLINPVCVF